MLAWIAVAASSGCASQQPAPDGDRTAAVIHLGARWFQHRGAYLGMTPNEAEVRDGELDDSAPPQDHFWDEQLAVESASLWRKLCNECHGGRRSIQRSKELPGPPEGWGDGAGQFFGRERARQEIFRVIFHGGEPPKDPAQQKMPPWGDRLAREQIWALVWFIEQASSDVVLTLPLDQQKKPE